MNQPCAISVDASTAVDASSEIDHALIKTTAAAGNHDNPGAISADHYREPVPFVPRGPRDDRGDQDYAMLYEQQTRLLLQATINGQEAEREQICLDLHDGVCQTLAAAFQYLETVDLDPALFPHQASRLLRAQELVRLGIQQAREIVGSLRPARLDALGLIAALHHDVRDLAERTGIAASCESDVLHLPHVVETALYRIIHEALNNVVKHAHATHVAVRFHRYPDSLVVLVEDNGIGFTPGGRAPDPHVGGVGLISMRRRTEMLRGQFELRSIPGHGTSICLTLPLYVLQGH
jgi:signal transduction histidine kinase